MGAGCSSQPPRRSAHEVEQHARKLSVLAPHERPDPLRAVKLGVDPTALINEHYDFGGVRRERDACAVSLRVQCFDGEHEPLRPMWPHMVVPQASSVRVGSAPCIV